MMRSHWLGSALPRFKVHCTLLTAARFPSVLSALHAITPKGSG
jgi:hypothetical protein